MDLYDYLRALKYHWLGALTIVVIAGVAAFTFSSTRPAVYAADATGFVGTGQSKNPALGTVNDSFARSRATSYVDIAKSRATASQVIDDLNLKTTPSALVRQIEVAQPPDTVLLKVTADASTPQNAQRLANAWVRALAEQVHEIESPRTPVGKVPDGTPRVIPVESAELPISPVSPNIPRDTAIGLAVGLLLALAYSVARSNVDRRLRHAEDITERFQVPVVGEIPTSGALKSTTEDGVGRVDTDPAAGEAFRKLRTNLMYIDVDDPPRVLVVTSPKVGDGKSTIAAHIATTLETTGQRVVLVDADLRRPTLAKRFGADDAVGLTTVLVGQVAVEEALLEAPNQPGLHLLTAGPLPPNPSELLGSKAWKTLVGKLSSDAYVVVDAPPLLPVTDAAILSRSADGTFVVVASGHTIDIDLDSAFDALKSVGARTLGVVLNRVKRKRGYGGDYHYYYAAKRSAAKQRQRAAKKGAGRADRGRGRG